MKPLIVNADYDDVLHGGKPDQRRVVAVECVAMWFLKAPLRVHRFYPESFLDYVEEFTGHRPQLLNRGEGENWWGALKQPELERELNSKLWAHLWWKPRWNLEGEICRTVDDVTRVLTNGKTAVLKRAHAMSGRGNKKMTQADWAKDSAQFESWLTQGLVAEPFYQRVSDLSALWLPGEKRFIYYRNQIDDRFQWRGVVLENGGEPIFSSEELSAMGEWKKLLLQLAQDIEAKGYLGPFSVDAFFYLEEDRLKFHPCSEVNARKTMGWMALELWKKDRPSWCKLWLEPLKLNETEWARQHQTIAQDVWLLSPPDSPFVWYWSERA